MRRVRMREFGLLQNEIISRAAATHDIVERAKVEDFTVSSDDSRSITDVSKEVLQLAGWLVTPA